MTLLLSEESCKILVLFGFFHNETVDEVADAAIQMMPFHEKRSQQIYEMLR